MTAPASGKTGTILKSGSPISEIKNWKANPKGENAAYATNAVPGFKRRTYGTVDITGTFQMLDNPEAYGLSIGSEVSIALYTTTGNLWSTLPVMIDDYSLSVDIDTGQPNVWDVNWGLSGQPTPWPPNSSN